MIVLFSGEGASDIGSDGGDATIPCQPERFTPGPMALLAAQLLDIALSRSGLEGAMTFDGNATVPARMISKSNLSAYLERAPALRVRAAGEPKDALTYKVWAGKLARCALDLSAQEHDSEVLAILFHDADGTNTSARSMWSDKYKMMCRGFELMTQQEGCRVRGVAMLAKPKSEAWLLCALRTPAYQRCAALEDESGNDASPNALKGQLARVLDEDGDVTPAVLSHIEDRRIDALHIDMPSFNQFRRDLREALSALGYAVEVGALGTE